MAGRLLIKDATIITLDDANRIFEGSVAIDQGRIVAVEPSATASFDFAFDE